jgi:hypothetical protein
VFQHALRWLSDEQEYCPDICVHLRPTCPRRDPATIDAMVQLLCRRPDVDSLRTIVPVVHPPFKMWYRDHEGLLNPVVPQLEDVTEPWNQPRQTLPPTYLQSASIDVIRATVITESASMTGNRVFGYVEREFLDIDTPDELRAAAQKFEQGPSDNGANTSFVYGDERATFCFDIDGVIASRTPDNNYALARPRTTVIRIVNRLYDAGHRIVLFTARGYVTGSDWHDVTVSQMKAWNVKYHELKFGKPAADYYVDDRMISLDSLDEFVRRFEKGVFL